MTVNHASPITKLNAFQQQALLESLDTSEFLDITRKAGSYRACRDCCCQKYDIHTEKIAFNKFGVLVCNMKRVVADPGKVIAWLASRI